MSRQFWVDLYAVNVSATPHPPGVYEEIIKKIFLMKLPVPIWGDRFALMTELNFRKRKGEEGRTGASGVISTFTDIDVDAPWLNRSTGKAAEESDTRRIQIPEALRPHFAQFVFHFDFATHTLSFQGNARMPRRGGGYKAYSLTPTHMQNYLEIFFKNSEVLGRLDMITATVIPDPRTVGDILRSSNIREIRMVVTTPNTDNIATERGRVRARLGRLNARKKVEVYTALDDNGIQPDAEMIRAANVSALDGEVEARIETEAGIVPLSTKDRPYCEKVSVDTSIEPELTAIKTAAEKLAKSAKGKIAPKPKPKAKAKAKAKKKRGAKGRE